MHDKLALIGEAQNSSKDRIIHAVLQLWEEVGSTHMSVRLLAQTAVVPVSSIYHHFGSLEQLFVVAQDHARECAAAWRDAHLRDLASAQLDGAAFAPYFAALIDDWAQGQRRLAFAWREGQQLALRDPHFRAGAIRWNDFWRDFWVEVSAHFGLEQHANLTTLLFDSEGFFHMFRWRRAVDRAGLAELARGWTAWLTGEPAPLAPMRDFAREEALRELPALPDWDETAGRIAEAAAAIISEKGASSMTHRAVAAQAGLTLGIVSHKFRTSAELMGAAFEALYLRNVSRSGGSIATQAADSDDPWSLNALVEIMQRSATNFGPEELYIVVARDPSFHHFAAQLRYLRGRSSGPHLQAIWGPSRLVTPLDAALFSGFMSGQLRTQLIVPEGDFALRIRRELEQLLDLIAPRKRPFTITS